MPSRIRRAGSRRACRAWTDVDRDWVADCDLLNPNAQDLRAAGGDFCGAFANRNFGNPNVFSNTVDPDIQHGWGVRPSDWNFGVSVQHELIPRVSIDVGYVRRVFHGFTVTDNLADWTERRHRVLRHRAAGLAAARRRWIPGGGTLRRQPERLRPDQQLHHHVGQLRRSVSSSSTAWTSTPTPGCRRAHGAGRLQLRPTTSDSCEVRAKVPETALLDPYCHVVTGYLPHYKGSRPTTSRKSTCSSA